MLGFSKASNSEKSLPLMSEINAELIMCTMRGEFELVKHNQCIIKGKDFALLGHDPPNQR